MEEYEDEWLKPFLGKTESELAAMQPPLGMTGHDLTQWHRDWDAVRARLRRAAAKQAEPESEEPDENEEPDDVHFSFAKEKAKIEAALSALESDGLPPGAAQSVPSQPLEVPKGNAADLLEQQIATCAALIGNIANYVAHNETATEVCFPFMDRISSMLSSSASAARVVGQLRGIAAETKQTIVTEKGGRGVGGVPHT